jgi:hypothetical protein
MLPLPPPKHPRRPAVARRNPSLFAVSSCESYVVCVLVSACLPRRPLLAFARPHTATRVPGRESLSSSAHCTLHTPDCPTTATGSCSESLIRTGQKKETSSRHPPPAAQDTAINTLRRDTLSTRRTGHRARPHHPQNKRQCHSDPALSHTTAYPLCPENRYTLQTKTDEQTNKQTATARPVDSATPQSRSLATVLACHDLARFTTTLSCSVGLCRHATLDCTLPCTAFGSSRCRWYQPQCLHFAHRVRVFRIISG